MRINIGVDTNVLENLKKKLEVANEVFTCEKCDKVFQSSEDEIKEIESKIKKVEHTINNLSDNISLVQKGIDDNNKILADIQYNKRLIDQVDQKKSDISNCRNEYQKIKADINLWKENEDQLKDNEKLDIEIKKIEENIRAFSTNKMEIEIEVERYKKQVQSNNITIEQKNDLIREIQEEIEKDTGYKIYSQIMGKNGIGKMILKKAVPMINSELEKFVSHNFDFEIILEVDKKNNFDFYLIKEEQKRRIALCSGLETTVPALCIALVLSYISALPKGNIIFFDEIFGQVSEENYDNIKEVLTMGLQLYDKVLIISHREDIQQWCQSSIYVRKQGDISDIEQT